MLRRRLFFLTCLCCFATSAVLAQDVETVAGGPETHKVLVDNGQVRVFDIRFQPGQKVAMHSHPPTTTYYVTDCKMKVTGPDGKSQVAEIKAGTAFWRRDTTHAAENVGTAECHSTQTELKKK